MLTMDLLDGESGAGESSAGSPIQPRGCQHSRQGSGTVEEEVCVLDSCITRRGAGSCEREVGWGDRDSGAERVGEGEDGGEGDRRGECQHEEVDMNGVYFVDTQGMTPQEEYWQEREECDYLYDRVDGICIGIDHVHQPRNPYERYASQICLHLLRLSQ